MKRDRLCPDHAKTRHDGGRYELVDPDDCDDCRIERLRSWVNEQRNR